LFRLGFRCPCEGFMTEQVPCGAGEIQASRLPSAATGAR
jgi:hypothetical protein